MSETHPNRQPKIKTRLGLTRARIFEAWPFLVWAGVALLGLWGYTRGTVFSRMNGAVDVYQENITPLEDGRLAKILVKRGDYVEPNALLAEMDSTGYKTRLSGILLGVAANRKDEILRLQRQVISLEKEQRDYLTTQAADIGKLAALKDIRDRYAAQYGSNLNAAAKAVLRANLPATVQEKLDSINADIGEITGRQPATETGLEQVKKTLDNLTAEIGNMHKAAELATGLATKGDYSAIPAEVLAGLNDNERRDVTELKTFIDLCELRTTKGGTVDKLEKEAGEYAKAGESVLRVVADPEQIVGFLPQEHSNDLKVGDAVWITPAQDRHQVFETKVQAISPRINSLADATSPLPNRRLYGRDVVVEYPRAALPAQKGGMFRLVPGQTIIIHTDKPGELPWMNRIFHNDDINAQ
ncbi:MAG: HlyD family efflux transporter periplasmic adaptor subunit [Verrucomicrobiaceae bacterium]|nr:MAG: HlyD family efflux transporter periplasmic adaptor subunit [Verrucomicrobiaceae bacterium]